LFLEGISREVFWNKPRHFDRVVSDQVHSVSVTPDIRVFHL
jgi:hypothetical protein